MMRNKRLSEEDFFNQRKEVLAQWPTGRGIDLDEAVGYHKGMPAEKNMANKLLHAREQGKIYCTTGMGKTTVEEQIELLQYTEREGRADILGLTPDSITRQNDYAGAQRGLDESIRAGRSMLNGLPVVNHGVAGIRKIIEAVNCPVQPRYGAADARLCDEILFAGGCSCSCPDIFMDFWQHHAKTPLEKVVETHQYSLRLMGYYTEHGVPMWAMAQGFYGAGLPPSLQTAAAILSLLAAAEQGVKNLGVTCACHGNLVQDVAAGTVRVNLLKEYLNKAGYRGVEVFPNVSFSLMAYPVEVGANFTVVFMNTLMAKLIGAQLNDIRTVAEAKAIPTKEDMAYTFRTAKMIENLLQPQKLGMERKAIEQEARMEEAEVRCILDKVLEFGDGDALAGAAKAVETGVLDNPFAANRAAAAKVMSIKDSEGAIRYFSTGNLPFTKEIIDYHKEKIAERERRMGTKIDYDTLLLDLLSVSRGYLVG